MSCTEPSDLQVTSRLVAQFEVSCISGEFHILERRRMIAYELKRVGLQPFSYLYQLLKYVIVSCSFIQQCHSFPS